ncbi:MAG: 4a-hydroxytetrahydrobiopterin dehydratase [Betaproteobacteria bacterium]|jgi:4a-hydroxytetrahydrobiopterin dehydratase
MQEVKLSSIEIYQSLNTLNNWTLDADALRIGKEWRFDSFRTAMNFLLKVADIAELQDHHPDIFCSFTKVRIQLITHDANGLTHKDFALAVEIDRLIKSNF